MIPLQLYTTALYRTNYQYPHHIPMMTRHCSRKYISRPPHTNCSKRTSIRNNPLYSLRSAIFLRLLLSFLPFKSSSYPRTWRLLTPSRHQNTKSIRGPSSKHICPSSLWSLYHMSTPQFNRRKPKTYNPSIIYHNLFRIILYITSGFRILRNILHHFRRNLWLNLLYSHRLSWPTCNYWIHFPNCMSPTSTKIPLYIQPPFRF